MRSEAKTPAEYLESIPDDRKEAVTKLYKTIKKNLPKGFQEVMGYGMPGWVVPHKLYAGGYHCTPELPLPFISFASQKNFIALYHMGLYSNKKMLEWFQSEWKKATPKKLDMGKSCIRFKKPEDIPFDLIGELATKFTPQQWIEVYSKWDPRNKTK
ncbi:MAG: DUF1801 domain-containing protein [Pyrinomonadaceae bacterium]